MKVNLLVMREELTKKLAAVDLLIGHPIPKSKAPTNGHSDEVPVLKPWRRRGNITHVKGKRRMSAAVKAKLSKIAKKRWRVLKAAGKNSM